MSTLYWGLGIVLGLNFLLAARLIQLGNRKERIAQERFDRKAA